MCRVVCRGCLWERAEWTGDFLADRRGWYLALDFELQRAQISLSQLANQQITCSGTAPWTGVQLKAFFSTFMLFHSRASQVALPGEVLQESLGACGVSLGVALFPGCGEWAVNQSFCSSARWVHLLTVWGIQQCPKNALLPLTPIASLLKRQSKRIWAQRSRTTVLSVTKGVIWPREETKSGNKSIGVGYCLQWHFIVTGTHGMTQLWISLSLLISAVKRVQALKLWLSQISIFLTVKW